MTAPVPASAVPGPASPAPVPAPVPVAASSPAAATVQLLTSAGWVTACPPGLLEAGRGVAVLLPDGGQAALFRDRAGELYAIGNVDPFTGAGVLARGLLGAAGGRTYVASPLLKQRFDLASGRCLDDDGVTVPSYPVRVVPDPAVAAVNGPGSGTG